MLETLSRCPACNTDAGTPFIEARDWLVSQETFSLVCCNGCGLVYTNPRPTEATVGAYYQSEAYVSHTNTKKGLINTIYQLVRNRTLSQKRGLIESLNGGKKGALLDVGCATGHFLATCQEAGWQTQGTEPDAGARQQAMEKGLAIAESVFDLQGENMFDVITLWHVLEHVHRLQETVHAMYKLLKPGGHLIIAVPNRLSLDAVTYGADWAAYDVPRHLYHFDPTSLQKLLERVGFTFLRRKPMIFDAYYVAMLSERNRGGGLFSAFFTGLRSNLTANTNGQYSSLMHIFAKPA